MNKDLLSLSSLNSIFNSQTKPLFFPDAQRSIPYQSLHVFFVRKQRLLASRKIEHCFFFAGLKRVYTCYSVKCHLSPTNFYKLFASALDF